MTNDMVTPCMPHKRFMAFQDKNEFFMGIPEETVLNFLDKLIKSRQFLNENIQQKLNDYLVILDALREETDYKMGELVECTIIDQIIESKKPANKRVNWIVTIVAYIVDLHVYKYTNKNLADLNRKLNVSYKIPWVYRMLCMRHQKIKIVKDTDLKKKMSKGLHTCIMIPAEIIDNVIKRVGNKSGTILQEGNEKIESQDEHVKIESKENQDITPQNAQVDQEIKKAEISQANEQQKEIIRVIEAILERENTIAIAKLKGKVESISDNKEIDWVDFLNVIEIMTKESLITRAGTTITKKK